MFNLELFLQWCKQHNGNQVINYHSNDIATDESFYQLIQQCCDDVDFQQTINTLISQSNKSKEDYDFSLRMTYHEADFN